MQLKAFLADSAGTSAITALTEIPAATVLPTHADTKSLGVQLPKLKQTYGDFIGFDTEIPVE
eukprot:4190790-Prorocentrum_lima.AAC.1